MTEKKTCKNCKHYLPPQQKKEGREGIGYYCTKNHTILKYYHCEEHEHDKNIEG